LITADTSFLVSLFGGDLHTAAAQSWAHNLEEPIVVTALTRYEFANAIRFAAFRKAVSSRDVLATLAAFAGDLAEGNLQLMAVDWAAMIEEAERLSASHTLAQGHRSFDILLVASASVLKAKTFLTFDLNQRKLARAARLAVGP